MSHQSPVDQARQRARMPRGTAIILDTRTLTTAHRRLAQLLRLGGRCAHPAAWGESAPWPCTAYRTCPASLAGPTAVRSTPPVWRG